MNQQISLLLSLSRADAVIARRLSGHGLSVSDYAILHHLSNAPERKLRRIDLAHKLGLTASGITRMLLPLEKLHIIERDQNGEDARARYASITNAGEELFRDATATIKMKLEDSLPQHSKLETKKLTAFLDELIENLLQGEKPREPKRTRLPF